MFYSVTESSLLAEEYRLFCVGTFRKDAYLFCASSKEPIKDLLSLGNVPR